MAPSSMFMWYIVVSLHLFDRSSLGCCIFEASNACPVTYLTSCTSKVYITFGYPPSSKSPFTVGKQKGTVHPSAESKLTCPQYDQSRPFQSGMFRAAGIRRHVRRYLPRSRRSGTLLSQKQFVIHQAYLRENIENPLKILVIIVHGLLFSL